MLRNNVTVADEIFNKTCTLCSYCFRRIQNNDIPSISIKHNNFLIEPVPDPAGTQRCFNVDSTLIFGRDVVQPFFNVETTSNFDVEISTSY